MKIAEIAEIYPAVNATVKVPGSKSYTLRALFIAALCDSMPELTGMLESDDAKAMRNCLENIKEDGKELFAGESGITARFMTALACISKGNNKITGAPTLLKRPIRDLVEALRQLGAKIEYQEKEGFLPLIVQSSDLSGKEVKISGRTSSQYLSALLLIGPYIKSGLEITVEDEQISKPYIDITIDIMNSFGVSVENDNYHKYSVKPQKYRAKAYEVEGDYSSAAYFYAINALTGSNIKVANLNPGSKQGDKKFVDLIKTDNWQENGSRSDDTRIINAEDFPDQAMTLAVLAAFQQGKTVIEGVRSLRIKETERVKAVENELAKMGIKTESTDDKLTIYGGKPNPALIDTYNDHRIAMSFAVAGLRTGGAKIFRPEVVNKTFPGFWDELSKITKVAIKDFQPDNLLLIGMRGSGKTTIGKFLAKRLRMDFVDMDEFIEQNQGRKIREIVENNGWDHFRQLESEACKELAMSKNTVIASGGGVILKGDNMSRFAPDTLRLLFVADPDLLSERIRGDQNRHELTGQPTLLGELNEVWNDRKERYYQNADFIFDTSGDRPEEIAEYIIKRLEL